MMHVLCFAAVLLGLAILDYRAHRRALDMLAAIGSLRGAEEHGDDDTAEDEEQPEGGGLLISAEFGDEGEEPTVVVPVALDAETTARIDETVTAVREAGDRPSGAWPAYRSSPPPDDPDPPA